MAARAPLQPMQCGVPGSPAPSDRRRCLFFVGARLFTTELPLPPPSSRSRRRREVVEGTKHARRALWKRDVKVDRTSVQPGPPANSAIAAACAPNVHPLPMCISSQCASAARNSTRRSSAARVTRRASCIVLAQEWLKGHDCGAEWDMPEKEERMLVNWFNALDVDQSGTIDASEIRQMMTSIGVKLTLAQLSRMFTSIGKQLNQPLEAHDFVRLMHLLGGSVRPAASFRLVPSRRLPSGGRPYPSPAVALRSSTDLALLGSSSAACRIALACAAWPLPLWISKTVCRLH